MDQNVRILDKKGTCLGILVNCSVVRDRAGAVVGAVETFRPVGGLGVTVDDEASAHANIIGVCPAIC